ncbi:xylulokinase [Ruegeria lacuscaerulensis ITI-1157]|nr:xylulokinase [Ruegeria lacuscaerulensis ITI-1157]SHJ79573.1 xylulokinase [Ruegeria lacuscaerulensis ITI-1157]
MGMFLGIDLGTSGVKAILVDAHQRVLAEGHAALQVNRPHPGWSEQNPDDWIAACETAVNQVRQAVPLEFSGLAAIGVSGQMHGATLLDAQDRPLRQCILWNDGRAAEECAELEARADFRGIGGNIVMAGFTAPKLAWVARHEPEILAATCKILLPKDYVNLWLTGDYVSDMSDASGTLWLDVRNRRWSDELLQATGLNISQVPRLVEGSEPAGFLRAELAQRWGVGKVTVAGGAGDNAATACGLGVLQPGQGFLSLGTSGVLFCATDRFLPNTGQAVHAFCHALPDSWHQMGVILSATDSLNWLAGIAGQSPAALSRMVSQDAQGPAPAIFLPYLSGERTPHNAPDMAGAFVGLRRDHGLPEIVHAVMDGVAFAFADCADALRQGGSCPEDVWVAGGGSRSRRWLEIISACTGLRLMIPATGEKGAALGAARLAQWSTGMLPDTTDKADAPVETIEADPEMRHRYQARLADFRRLAGVGRRASV